jgi:hypothetical protein
MGAAILSGSGRSRAEIVTVVLGVRREYGCGSARATAMCRH